MSSLKFSIVGLILISSITTLFSQERYNRFFTQERLRADVIFGGDERSQMVYLDALFKESIWSGSRTNLIDSFNYGEYRYKVFTQSGEEIFSKGFNNLFQEWRTTAEAKTMKRAFMGSYWIPFPKERVTIVFYERLKESGEMSEIGRFPVDPNDKLINSEIQNNYKSDTIHYSGPPEVKADIVFVAEGYTADEMDKFIKDANRFAGYLFDIEPYKSRKNDFNIWAVRSVSRDSGCDIPQSDIWKSTAVSSSFYTFRIDRYLTAPNQKLVASSVSNLPCDAMYVIVNTDKYGGGGIYNFYGLSMSDHKFSAEVFVHELGHSFAGLGDEYYSSEVAYEEFYNLNIEPWEPNITTLKNFDSKWRSMILPETPQPTPSDPEFKNVVGLFEGGGYMAKGIYRPYLDCRMKANTAEGFCPVCRISIERVIDYYTK
ncbi:MAG: M64 family metallopeptidase [Bacteroidales bacterium]|jgi:hypothetical protein|nr:M64 family metallopeptidase [Bacteroidales bacterium]